MVGKLLYDWTIIKISYTLDLSPAYVEAQGRQAVQNFRYALLFKISIPVLNIDELELNVGNRLSGVQMIGDLGAPGRA